jgi:hypothetical protein
VSITLKKLWKVIFREYIYLILLGIAYYSNSFFQAYLYSIVWYSQDFNKASTTITLLIQRCKGFSNTLIIIPSQSSAIVNGPYSQIQSLNKFNKVFLITSKIGIAAYLFLAKYLLKIYKNCSTYIHRLSLI